MPLNRQCCGGEHRRTDHGIRRFQFIHVEVYARAKAGKSKTERWTMRDVFAELSREAGACPHVADPRAPVLLYGTAPAETERTILADADNAADPRRRKLRKDAPVVMVGVLSLPVPPGAAAEQRAGYDAWEADAIAWLGDKYGRRLRMIVRHEDERFLHLYCVLSCDFSAGERIEILHPGRAAMAEARAEGIKERKILDQRYRAAMRGYQDEYYRAVGLKHGLTRHGPGRRRLTRLGWHAEQEQAATMSGLVREAEANAALLAAEQVRSVSLEERFNKIRDQATALLAELANPVRRALGRRPEWVPEAIWNAFRMALAPIPVPTTERGLVPTRGPMPVRSRVREL